MNRQLKTRRLAQLAGAALLVAGLIQPAQARSLQDIRAEGVLHVGSINLPPFVYQAGGKYVGFEAELITLLAAELNLNVEFSDIQIDNTVASLANGKIDVMVGGQTITSTQGRNADFTQPYLCLGVSVVARDPAIQTRLDLENKTIGVISGSTVQSYVQKLPFAKKTNVYTNTNDLTLALADGQIDATLVYGMMAPALAKMYPKLKVSFGPTQWSVPVGAKLPVDQGALRLALNGRLARVMRDGRFEKLSTKYFGADLRCKS
ncbi:ABC transporter substrate-binding protein [Deinococcus sp.]|uniref:ABC transporter substrate-binding protein n=1 Tax=Deinococcus sp. TaxID=47478 RepID=UPI0025CF6170|nr:ABC transporter substrate-binding protein [Deinococcus sp.]